MADEDKRFDALVKYYPGVLALLRRLNFSIDDAYDLAQEVFLRVHKSMKDYRGEAHWAYLEPIVRRAAANWIRDRHAGKRNAVTVSEEALVDLQDDHVVDPDAAIDEAAAAGRLHQAIAKLERNDRTVLLLLLRGLSYEEMVEQLGLSLSAVKSRLNAARKRLKELMRDDPRLRGE